MDTPEEIFHLVEVKGRIAEVESGRVELVPGDEVLVRARLLLAALSDEDEGLPKRFDAMPKLRVMPVQR